MKLTWHPERVKRRVIETLTANAEPVGVFVEVEARRRLHAIEEPKWGRRYRQMDVSRLLTHQVVIEPNQVLIIIGVRTSPTSSRHGFYIEMGSSRFPAHPYLRPALFDNRAKIKKMLLGGM